MAKEYAAFGVTYEAKENQWYLDGETVRFCHDVLTSNGESPTGGKLLKNTARKNLMNTRCQEFHNDNH